MSATAIDHATSNGWTMAVAGLDPSGIIFGAGRMDGAPPQVLDSAIDNAFTSTTGSARTALASAWHPNHR